jgi:hypothetical protein
MRNRFSRNPFTARDLGPNLSRGRSSRVFGQTNLNNVHQSPVFLNSIICTRRPNQRYFIDLGQSEEEIDE